MKNWNSLLKQEQAKDYFQELAQYIDARRRVATVYPVESNLFKAFELTPYEKVKVVILGQDPYHQPNQAHGLSFSVETDMKLPPSLRNIYKELVDDLGIAQATHGNLTNWAKQGVLLLNTILTVEDSRPLSHQNKGWELFTDEVIRYLNAREEMVIFVLWGKSAQLKQQLITNERHICLCSAHPSPLSAYRGFFGSRVFSRINQILLQNHLEPIDWRV